MSIFYLMYIYMQYSYVYMQRDYVYMCFISSEMKGYAYVVIGRYDFIWNVIE